LPKQAACFVELRLFQGACSWHAAQVRLTASALFLALFACEGDGGLGAAASAPIFQPSALVFGARDTGDVHQLDVLLTSDAERALSVLSVEFTENISNVYAARLVEGGTLKDTVLPSNVSVAVQVIFQPLEPEAYDGVMRVVTEDKVFELALAGSGRDVVNKDLILTPTSFDFGAVAIGTTATKEFEIRNALRESQIINEVRSLASRRVVQAQQSTFWITHVGQTEALSNQRIGSRAKIMLAAHFRPRSVGALSDTLQLMSSEKGFAPLLVSGMGSAGGRLNCDPSALDFGNVRRGSAADLYTECTVDGGVYKVESASLEQGTSTHFSGIAGPPSGAVFGAGDTFGMTVRFNGMGLASRQEGNLVVRSTHGDTTMLVLTGTVSPTPKPETALTVHLEWDTQRTDFDLHLVRASGAPFELLNDCYFLQKNPDWGQAGWSLDDPYLDRDDLDSGGPEEINLAAPSEDRYDIYVHYYGANRREPTFATVRIEFFGVTALNETRLFDSCGEMWKVAEVMDLNSIARFNFLNEVSQNPAAGMCP
jgi:hypothetical protein